MTRRSLLAFAWLPWWRKAPLRWCVKRTVWMRGVGVLGADIITRYPTQKEARRLLQEVERVSRPHPHLHVVVQENYDYMRVWNGADRYDQFEVVEVGRKGR